jgi:hypothetical protein
MLFQHPRNSPQHRGVIIHDKHELSIIQENIPMYPPAADEDRHAEANFAQLNRSTTPIRRPLAQPLLCVCEGNPR